MTTDSTRALDAAPASTSGRWWVLVILAMAQLVVVLDATIVNIALPSAQADLGFSDSDRQWVITGYALAFGSLLLLGGRLADFFGRKKMFMVGLVGFAAASALGGAAPDITVLISARALQGAFGALLAPAALSLLTTTFVEAKERATAFGIYGAISGAGGAIGLLLGGVLTEYADWRWTLFVNVPIAALALVGAVLVIREGALPARKPLDVPGAITSITGLVGVVYGLGNAETDGWSDSWTIGPIVAGVIVLAIFVLIESRSAHPLLPMRVVLNRNRGGAYIAIAISGAGMFGVFLFLTYYLSEVLAFTPVETGLAFLPMVAAIMLTATTIGTRLTPVVGPRPLVTIGSVIAAAGMYLLTLLDLDSTYVLGVLPGLVIVGLGLGLVFAPAQNAATAGVEAQDAGVAGAMVNTMQQIGGSIGIALFSSFFAEAVSDYLAGKTPTPELGALAALDGYQTVFWWSLGLFALCAATSIALFKNGPLEQNPDAEPVFAH